MAKVCEACGKGKASGNNVSHSKRRTRRTFDVNLHKKDIVTINGVEKRAYLCTRCVRTSNKHAQ
ncbi:MAG: 50S ribosomal protein L28 [Firmicutes bacterium]|nr:50S ribosomal protein L28 [Bacillota bacterium]MCL1953806.1 50S ribosomal protein L28 [Bacillota bacterium]